MKSIPFLSERLSEHALLSMRSAVQVFEFIGGACRIRTYDHLIKSQVNNPHRSASPPYFSDTRLPLAPALDCGSSQILSEDFICHSIRNGEGFSTHSLAVTSKYAHMRGSHLQLIEGSLNKKAAKK